MTGAPLPALSWLGYGLNLTQITPIGVEQVRKAVIRDYQLIDTADEYRDVEVGGVTYSVPKNVLVIPDEGSVQSDYVTYENGVEASNSLEANATISASYLAVQGSASVSYAINKSFTQNYQYALFALNATQYQAAFKSIGAYFDEDGLKEKIQKLLTVPFDSSDTTVRGYKEFFSLFGTHIITGVSYGARFQLGVWQDNSTSSSTSTFSANVQAKYNGVTSNGSFDASVKTTSSYTTFETQMQVLTDIRGGDEQSNILFAKDPTNYANFVAWSGTVEQNPDLVDFQTQELWSLMLLADDDVITGAAQSVQDAFSYIVNNPALHLTKASIEVQSDWAEVGFITPSAIVRIDPENLLPDNTYLDTTKVRWGREHAHIYQRTTVYFEIINDGSPVDFYISHGSDGSSSGSGQAVVTFNGNSYTAAGITDNNWNTKWFWQAPVNPLKEE